MVLVSRKPLRVAWGETLLYPWKVQPTMPDSQRVDRALVEGLNGLSAGEGPMFVVRGLEEATDGGAGLAGKVHWTTRAERLQWLVDDICPISRIRLLVRDILYRG